MAECKGVAVPLRVGLLGATLETGNLGVSALALSTVGGLVRTGARIELTLFDRRPGVRRIELASGDWKLPARAIGLYYSRRLYSANNLQQCLLAARLGLGRLHPVLREMAALDMVLDVSGGDSFTDLYGERRFLAQTYPKRIAIALGVPLVLLPQTYGPFEDPGKRGLAEQILAGASRAYSRDPRGLEALQALLGERFDPDRHRGGVDVAFGLQPRRPEDARLVALVDAARTGDGPLLGLNVSGLLHADPQIGPKQFGFRDPYPDIVQRLLERLLEVPEARVLLISHVQAPGYAEGGDHDACLQLLRGLGAADAERVTVVPHIDDPAQTKWVIGQCDWFSGTRMHACIGALSQGVPTAALAYSDKTLGVLETAGAGDWVVDPRKEGAEQVVRRIAETVPQRKMMAERIGHRLAEVRARLDEEFAEIVALRGEGSS